MTPLAPSRDHRSPLGSSSLVSDGVADLEHIDDGGLLTAAMTHSSGANSTAHPSMAPCNAPVTSASSIPPRLLPLDPSVYSNSPCPFPAWTQTQTSLSELSHLLKTQRYEEQRRFQLRVRLHRGLVSAGLSARLLRCGHLAYKFLIQLYRDDDQKAFAELHSALHDIRNSSTATRSYAILESDLEASKSRNSSEPNHSAYSTFIQEIPVNIRNQLLEYITEIRMNPSFLASRLCALSSQELLKLISFRSTSDGSTGRFSVKSARKSTAAERLLSFQRHDGLSALLFTIFANSSGPDSKEDRQRCEVWATACIRLLGDNRPECERVVATVLDAFAGLRDWPVKHKLELFLMQFLQEGRFLLEDPSEYTSTLKSSSERAAKKPLQYATEEFFDRSVQRLYAIIDSDSSAGGLPDGVLEIGRAIISKLTESPKLRDAAEILILFKWFFRAFLPHALIYPESVVVMPEVKTHIEHLLERLRSSQERNVLQEVRSESVPNETIEVKPFLVLCPSDVKTLVYALFPERSAPCLTGLTSSASFTTGISILGDKDLTSGGRSSTIDQSLSSIASDAASRAPALGQSDASCASMKPELYDTTNSRRSLSMEEYGRKLRIACSKMSQILGHDVVQGTCHPFADRWTVIHITKNGSELLTRMKKDMEGSGCDDDGSESDFEDDNIVDSACQESESVINYTQLKAWVIKLLSTYEVPKFLDTRAFSNRKRQSKRKHIDGSRKLTSDATDEPSLKKLQNAGHSVSSPERTSDLEIMLNAALHQEQTRERYVEALGWHKTLEALKKFTSASLVRDGYASLLNYFARDPRHTTIRCIAAIEEFEAWYVWLKQAREKHEARVDVMMLRLRGLRDKMWYKTAVLTSARYEDAKSVVIALKWMSCASNLTEEPKMMTYGRSKNGPTTIFQRSEIQALELLAAKPEHGGLNKLSDEQVDLTNNWLSSRSIEAHFCKGEERIHRFCMEMDRCVQSLVAESSLESPVLWSSELYRRDREILDGGKEDFWIISAGLNVDVEHGQDSQSGQSVSTGLDPVPCPSSGSPESISTQLFGQDLSTKRSSRPKTLFVENPHDYFGHASPMMAIDTKQTFWSPFHNRGKPDLEASASRQSSTLTRSTCLNDQQKTCLHKKKCQFLLELKQTLTGLLISDLGTALYSSGSETDRWFSRDYTTNCMRFIEAEAKRRRIKLLRKKSMRNVKREKEKQTVAPSPELLNTNESTIPTSTNEKLDMTEAASSNQPTDAAGIATSKLAVDVSERQPATEFPYISAYLLLFQKFSIHPNPFYKLHALYELRVLVEQSLLSNGVQLHSRDILPSAQTHEADQLMPDFSRRQSAVVSNFKPQNLKEAVAHVSERRSYTMQALGGPWNTTDGSRGHACASKDPIIAALQTLLRDPALRPATLFRDLQYISAFVPTSILEGTTRGKAFWDVALAALDLKQDVLEHLVRTADDVVQNVTALAHKTSPPESATSGTATEAKMATISPNLGLNKYTLADAASMYLIAAKEGDPAAERELAIFYLNYTQEESRLPRTLHPLSKGCKVFKTVSSRDKTRTGKNDQTTMCLARHWMEMSCAGGDELAPQYLQGKVDFGTIQKS